MCFNFWLCLKENVLNQLSWRNDVFFSNMSVILNRLLSFCNILQLRCKCTLHLHNNWLNASLFFIYALEILNHSKVKVLDIIHDAELYNVFSRSSRYISQLRGDILTWFSLQTSLYLFFSCSHWTISTSFSTVFSWNTGQTR